MTAAKKIPKTPRPDDKECTKHSITRSGNKMISKSTSIADKKTKHKSLPEDMKKYANSLNLFKSEQKEKFDKASHGDILESWHQLSEKEKQNYSDRSKEAREHFYGHSSGVNECIVKCHNTYSPSNENLTNDVQDDEE